VLAFAVEGTGSYGAGLVRFLERADVLVYECERPRRQERRRGKSDFIDAALAARRLLAGERLSLPRGHGRREDLRVLLLERRGAMRARNAALNQLSALVVTAPDHVRQRLGALSGEPLAQGAARLRPRPEVVNGVLRRLGKRAERLSKEVADAERALAALLAEVAPELLEECGVGPICGAQMLVSSGDRSRMTSEASFAAFAGTSPVDASSGKQRRHRLNRVATASSTGRCTSSPSPGSATTPRPPPTTSGSSLRARPPGRHGAASNARSPVTSTDAYARCRRSLDNIEASESTCRSREARMNRAIARASSFTSRSWKWPVTPEVAGSSRVAPAS
jgi:hypothetical protein